MVTISCGKPAPKLEGFDQQLWKNDKNACLGKRIIFEEPLRKEKQKLLSLSEMQIVDVLGRPDQNELYKRNQKFYTYFLEPAAMCKGDSTTQPKKLVVRFNAMGLAKEVNIE
jgi:hypothetical protein